MDNLPENQFLNCVLGTLLLQLVKKTHSFFFSLTESMQNAKNNRLKSMK